MKKGEQHNRKKLSEEKLDMKGARQQCPGQRVKGMWFSQNWLLHVVGQFLAEVQTE